MSEPAFKIIGSMEIAKLRLAADDVLVIKLDRAVTEQVADRIRKHITPMLPQGVKALIVNPGIELSVLTKNEIEAA